MTLFEVLRLSSGSGPNEKSVKFIQMVNDNYPENFLFNPKERIIDGGGVVLSVDKWLGGDVMIDGLRAVEPGGGRRALSIVCALADQHGVSLTTVASPLDTVVGKKMPLLNLVNWYRSFGFDTLNDYGDDFEGYDNIEMIRLPQQL